MSTRQTTLSYLIFCIAAGLASASFYFEYVENFDPCPLCLVQRGLVIAITLVMLVKICFRPARIGTLICAATVDLFATIGLVVSGYQVSLQITPHDHSNPAGCTSGLTGLLGNQSWIENLEQILSQSPACSEFTWTFLGLSMAAWMVFWFAILMLLSVAMVLEQVRR